ncbi:hypothetical protein HOY80DRAFT_199940 [Tuber brumale]|nr:hypothetical protein HOY80DRAFT_199940 [Tuber brumale]
MIVAVLYCTGIIISLAFSPLPPSLSSGEGAALCEYCTVSYHMIPNFSSLWALFFPPPRRSPLVVTHHMIICLYAFIPLASSSSPSTALAPCALLIALAPIQL